MITKIIFSGGVMKYHTLPKFGDERSMCTNSIPTHILEVLNVVRQEKKKIRIRKKNHDIAFIENSNK